MNVVEAQFRAFESGGDFQKVRQGHEEISCGEIQHSYKFAQCHAFLIINASDGVTLTKHVGPRSYEILSGGDEGIYFQEKFKLFKQHAEKYGQRVVVQQIYGDLSRTHKHLLDEVEKWAKEKQIEVTVAEPIQVNSGQEYTWDMFYNPRNAEVGIEYRNNGEKSYRSLKIPELDSVSFGNSHQFMEEVLLRRQYAEEIKRKISDYIYGGCTEELEQLMQQAVSEWGGGFAGIAERAAERIL